ncbi:hypothetical protein ACFYT4_09895 [Streptomyces sp. NPDC004609]|uniref:hypothetical protein n=1 Tax=Streptomyces sp. NPDC004609 TaxID=3364704 RepID=UPI003695870C
MPDQQEQLPDPFDPDPDEPGEDWDDPLGDPLGQSVQSQKPPRSTAPPPPPPPAKPR